MRAFIDARGRARWDYIIFGHNEHQVEEAEALAESWGVERFSKKKKRQIFYSKYQRKQVHLARNRKGEQTQAIAELVKTENKNPALQKTQEIEKTYGSMKDYYDRCGIKCKVAEEKNILITAEGLLMPAVGSDACTSGGTKTIE